MLNRNMVGFINLSDSKDVPEEEKASDVVIIKPTFVIFEFLHHTLLKVFYDNPLHDFLSVRFQSQSEKWVYSRLK